MRERVRRAVFNALKQQIEKAGVDIDSLPPISIEIPPEEKFGDFSTNAAMVCAQILKEAPRKIAENLISELEKEKLFQSVSVAGPGFINFLVKPEVWVEEFKSVPDDSSDYGGLPEKPGEKVLIEFVSANPTGPLHIGHGRGAAVGDALSRILLKAGYDVTKEYYINDTGLQMENLGRSTLARYRQLQGREAVLPENGYKGDYIKDIAKEIVEKEGDKYLDKPEEESIPFFIKHTSDVILKGIKSDLQRFRVSFDVWTSEKALHDSGKVDETLEHLKKSGSVFEEDGALWLKTTGAGDEKNRVVRRTNGVVTYLATDIAYHEEKYRRGFTKLINVWGADHHGYVARMKAAVKALGKDPETLIPLLIQLVNLKKGGEVIAMSTRAGTFINLKEVLEEVGEDAARFFFLTRSYDSHLDFDLDLAKEESSENPVYYVQYAHARISNIFRTARERGIKEVPPKDVHWEAIGLEEELRIIKKALAFPRLVSDCAETLSPHPITHYLVELSGIFHKYYNVHRVVSDDEKLTGARLAMVARLRTVLRNGLELLGVNAPDRM